MKKHLLTTAAVAALAVTSVSADAMKGFYVGGHAGASFANTGKLKGETGTRIAGSSVLGFRVTGNHKNSTGFNGHVALGHGATFGKAHFSGELTLGYDTSCVQIGTATATTAAAVTAVNHFIPGAAIALNTAYKVTYRPQFGMGLGVRTGMYLTHGLMGFVRLGVEYNFGKTEYDLNGAKHKDSIKVWSVTPGVGVMGHFNEDKMSWLIGADYKVGFSISKANNTGYATKPRSFVLKAGLLYHF